jgi:hypothetical protein
MSKKFDAKVLEICDNGDAIIELPDELMEEMGWKLKDKLDFKMKDGAVHIVNLTLQKRQKKLKT